MSNHSVWPKILTGLVVLMVLAGAVFPAAAQNGTPQPQAPVNSLRPEISRSVYNDTSAPLRDLAAAYKQTAPRSQREQFGSLQLPKAALAVTEPQAMQPQFLQNFPGTVNMPAPQANFDGVTNVAGVHPPDTNGDIGVDPATGKKYYFQWVNLHYDIWDVTNQAAPVELLGGPIAGNVLFAGMGGMCETTNDGDPIVMFDHLANRWNVSQFALNGPYYQCIAVSQTADPTGAWYRYAFLYSSSKMNDYPKLGVWPDGYYLTANQFLNGASWSGAGVVVYERSQMLLGLPARSIYFDLFGVDANFGGMLPSDLEGALAPAAGTPNYFAEWDDSTFIAPVDALRIWEFHTDWNNPANSTFGLNGLPNIVIPTANLNVLCGSTRNCIPQLGTTQKLDAIADRLMHRLQFRDFGTYKTLVGNNTVDAGGGVAGIHWFELRKTGAADWVIYQESTYAPDTTSRWMGSAAMDASGNIAIGYSASSASMYPAIRYAGRLAGDPVNTLGQAEVTLYAGTGAQTSSYARWGDYSSLTLDPVDDCTFWYTQEYIGLTSYANWKTRIGSFRFPTCASTAFGTLTGTVKDSSNNAPISGAKVELGGMSTLTNASGVFTIIVPADLYDIKASAFSYGDKTVLNVDVVGGDTTTLNFLLDRMPLVTVTGKVTDNSGHVGMPLYARLDISGFAGSPVFTNPFDGTYSVQLYQSTAYPFSVTALTGGYTVSSRAITPPAGGSTENFPLTADLSSCAPLGYSYSGGLIEHFESGLLPRDWKNIDLGTLGQVWQFTDPRPRGNLTGGTGKFAMLDSDSFGASGQQNAALISPSMNFTGIATVTMQFDTDYKAGAGDSVDVDVSVNGGTTWTNVWHRQTSTRGHQTINISALAGSQADVQVRWHYLNGNWDYWWQVDNVQIGVSPTCVTVPGGLVAGFVADGNTSAVLNGAEVKGNLSTSVATSAATPDDAAVADGFYVLFAPSATATVTGSMVGGYGPQSQAVAVVNNNVVRKDFNLPAGRLSAAPTTITNTLDANLTQDTVITLSDTGTLPANYTLTVVDGLAPLAPVATGPFAAEGRRVGPKRLNEASAENVYMYTPPAAPAWTTAQLVKSWSTGLTAPWGVAVTRSGDVWLSSAKLIGGDNQTYRLTSTGQLTGDVVNTRSWANDFIADMAYDPISGHIWQLNVGGDNCIYELNPATQAATGVKICHNWGHSERGLAYDALTETFYSASWTSGIVRHFDRNGTMLDSKSLGINIAGLAVNPITGHLFALVNANVGPDVYVLDIRNGYELVGAFDIPGMTDYGEAGLELTADGHLLAVDSKAGKVFEVATGESDLYAYLAVTWLTVNPLTGTVAAGANQDVTATLNSLALVPGGYDAHIRITEDTPYTVASIPVHLTVNTTRGVNANAPANAQFGFPGATVSYTVTVTNTGNVADSYTVSLGTHTWDVTAPANTGSLAPGASTNITVTVTIPADALGGQSEALAVTLTSVGNGSKTSLVTLTSEAFWMLYLPASNK